MAQATSNAASGPTAETSTGTSGGTEASTTGLTETTATEESELDTGMTGTDTSSGELTGPLPLPTPFFGELTGDYYVPAGTTAEVVFEDPDSPSWNTIHGSLRVEAGAEIRLNASLRVLGAVDCEAGSVVASEPWGFTVEVEELSVLGERDNPVTWTGASLTAGRADFERGIFVNGRMRIEGGPSALVDSTIDGTMVTLLGDGPETSRAEYNRFDGFQLYVSGASVQFNDFLFEEGFNGTLAFTPNSDVSWPNVVCEGEQTLAQDFVFENNVLGPVAKNDEHLTVDRDYGPVDISGNYFEGGLPNWDSIDDWDGPNGGCGGVGSFGGPATVQPVLNAPPAIYGPRP